MKAKKVICSVIVIIMIFGMLPMSFVTANAAASDFTAEQGSQWARDRANEGWCVDVDNSYGCQCVDLILAYYRYLVGYNVSGSATDYQWNDLPDGWWRDNTASPGAICVWGPGVDGADGTYGHIGIVTDVNGDSLSTVETNSWGVSSAMPRNHSASKVTVFIHPNFKASEPAVPQGHEMTESEAAGRTIPDGNYWIRSNLRNDYYINIDGHSLLSTANNGTNVMAWVFEEMPSEYDVFSITYLNNGFYKITQMNSNMSVDVTGASLDMGTNVQMYEYRKHVAQQWSIRDTGSGYTIQSKCNSYVLDVAGGNIANGTNVGVWESNGTDAQKWEFIPYEEPKAIDSPFQGEGSQTSPYLINSNSDLEMFQYLINTEAYASKYQYAYYELTADIDLGGQKWKPIGKRIFNSVDTERSFRGHFNGGNHTISGLYVNETSKFAGLFGSLNSGGVIENLAVQGKVINTDWCTGGIVGEICDSNGIVRNCCFIGEVQGAEAAAGGIVGHLYGSGNIINCYHIGKVSCPDHSAGGIIGRAYALNNSAMVIENCYHVGTVSGTAGSIVGAVFDEMNNRSIKIKNCYALELDGVTCGLGNEYAEMDVQKMSVKSLKNAQDLLGDAYIQNPNDNFIDGYPIFKWQYIAEAPDTASDVVSDTESDTDTDVTSDIESDTASDVTSDTESDTASDVTSDTESDTASDVFSDTENDTDSDVISDTENDTASDIDSETDSDITPDTDSDTLPEKTVITLNKTNAEMTVGEKFVLEPTVTPTIVDSNTIKWYVDETDVVDVFGGTVIATNPGTAVVTAVTEDGAFAECVVTVKKKTDYPKLTGILGDLDDDGLITANDALAILRSSIGMETFSPEQDKLADIDGDGSVTANDALAVLRYSVGIDDGIVGKEIMI